MVRAVVLNHSIRAKHVGTNLRTPFDVLLFADDGFEFRFAFLNLSLHELVGKHFHTGLLIEELASLDFARDDDTGWKVGDTNGRRDFVDVLSSCATASECIDFEVFRIDLDIADLTEFRDDVD